MLAETRILNRLFLSRLTNEGETVRLYQEVLDDSSLSADAKLKKMDFLIHEQTIGVKTDIEIMFSAGKQPLPPIYFALKESPSSGLPTTRLTTPP
jgi:hypothetical protein